MAQFNPVYQSIYEAALARQREIEARQRGLATTGAARAGVMTSGVGQLPQAEIGRTAEKSEMQIGAQVGEAQEGERLQDKAVEQRKELMKLESSLAEAALARQRELERQAGKSGITGQLIGGLVGGVGGAVAKKFLI